jgi:hypothetical protein
MFFVHYVTLQDGGPAASAESNQAYENIFKSPIEWGSMLHFKTPAEISGSVFGAWYVPFAYGANQSALCHTHMLTSLEKQHSASPAIRPSTKLYTNIPPLRRKQLMKAYRRRMLFTNAPV